MYNEVVGANRVTNLQLTRDQVCGIFTHAPGYRTWGDLARDNPVLAGDNNPITVITRNDLAGESYVLSEYCIATQPVIWQQFIGYEQHPADPNDARPDLANGQPSSNWPVALEGGALSPQRPGADGVADAVADPISGIHGIT
ncbi:MAG: substrate-binding domain-containing protein, partial [Actinomycetota bacterium]|nr:substrate-binding domain-containing protein [Actinomycetota bacterium]